MLTDTFPWYYDKYDLEKKEMNSFIQQECIKLIKSDSKNNNVTKKKRFQINAVQLTSFLLLKQSCKNVMVSNLKSII